MFNKNKSKDLSRGIEKIKNFSKSRMHTDSGSWLFHSLKFATFATRIKVTHQANPGQSYGGESKLETGSNLTKLKTRELKGTNLR